MATPHRPTDQSLVLIRKVEALAKTVTHGCTEAEAASTLAKMQALVGVREIDPPARQNFPDVEDTIVSLAEAVKLSGLSDDSWRRHHKNKFIRLSERRIGVRMRDALMRPG